MDETKADEVLTNTENPQAAQEQTETQVQAQLDELPPPEAPAPDIIDDDVVIPSNVIDGIFEEKQAAVKEAELKAAENTAQDKNKPEANAPEDKPARRGRPPKGEKTDKPEAKPEPDKKPKPKKAAAEKPSGGRASAKTKGEEKPKPTPKAEKQEPEPPTPPPEPTQAPRTGEQEQIVYLNLSELHPFKDHPFQVRQDAEMSAMVESVKDKGVTQPAIVRPREDGGYELVSGHRRHMASELANYTNMPCIIRDLTDEQAITQMVEDNTNQRENILPSERANALKMQLDAIKRQGARDENGGKGQRSNEVVADRNKMTVKQVQRYIKLTELVPDLMKMVDEKKIAFTPAVELAFIKPKNQSYIAVAIEGQQSAPSLSQSQRMRELDQKGVLNPDVIDGIMMEEKKEADKVILSSQELSKYFGPDKTPREMKNTILKLLDDNKAKHPPELFKADNKVKPPER